MPGEFLSFFSVLVNINKKKTLLELYYNGDYSEDILIEELEDVKLSMKAAKIRSLFQMFYNIFNGSQGIPLHIMKAVEVYKKGKNHNICELATVSLKNGLCECYITMKRHCSDLAKYAVVSGQGKERNAALSSYFPPSSFTVARYDNFGYVDKNTLLGNASAHYIAVTVFLGKTRQTFAKTVEEWSAFEQCPDTDKTAMSTVNTVYRGKWLEVARIN